MAQSIIYQVEKNDLENIIFSLVTQFYNEIENKHKAENEMLSVNATCDLLKVNRSTLYRWHKERYLVPIKVGKKSLYCRADVEKLMKTR